METAGKKLKMQIWDTAGQDRFESISTTFYKGKPFTPKILLFTKFIEVPLLTYNSRCPRDTALLLDY
jgi:hypothetical protein